MKLELPKIKVRSKIWLAVKGQPILGPGRMELLRLVDEQGSISKAARLLKISYRKAWGQIRAMEEKLGILLVQKQTGGPGGGGAFLTAEARKLLGKYEALIQGLKEEINMRFAEIFYGRR